MKRIKWPVHSLMVLFLLGCSLLGGVKPVSHEKGQGHENSVNFHIPASNAPAPSGILEQISWVGKGGPSDPTGEQKCGDCLVEIDHKHISFSNFQPLRELDVLIYRSTGPKPKKCADGTAEYVTTLTIQVDEAGNFLATLSGSTQDIRDLIVVSVLDVKTGDKIWKSYAAPYKQVDCSDNADLLSGSCPGAPPQKVKVDKMAYVCTGSDSVKLREGPGKNYPIIKSLVPGADVRIISGPQCADDWSWWKVKTESGYTGWMAEGGDNVDPYFICPRP